MKKNKKNEQQQGIILVVVLLFLVMMTILGLSTMNTTVFNEKMTSNLRDTTTAFGAAEVALTDGEAWLQAQVAPPAPISACGTPPCRVWQLGAPGIPYQQSTSWWQATAIPFSSVLSGLASQPYYIIEQYSFVPYDLSPGTLSAGHGYYYYQVTARGTGRTTNSLVNVQSIYSIQYN